MLRLLLRVHRSAAYFRMQSFGRAGPEWAGSGPKICQDGFILARWIPTDASSCGKSRTLW